MGTSEASAPRSHAVHRLRSVVDAEPIAWRRSDLVARWSDHTINEAVRVGAITRVAPALYVATLHLQRMEWRASAAAHWASPTGAVSGVAALWLYRIVPAPPSEVTVAAPHTFKRAPLPYVRLRRTTVPFDPTLVRGIRVTRVADALVHAWEELPARDRVGALLNALRAERATAAEVRDRLDAYPRVRGRASLCRVLGEADGGATSFLEHRARTRVFQTREFAGLAWQAPVVARGRRYVVDAFHRQARLAIELDGRAFHADDAARRRDLERDGDLATIGVQTLRFTFEDIVRRPDWCRTTVRATLLARLRRREA